MLNTNIILNCWEVTMVFCHVGLFRVSCRGGYHMFKEAEVKFVNTAYNIVLDKLMCRIIFN
jgi:hypothetical protein